MNDFSTLQELFDFIKTHYKRPDLVNYRKSNQWTPISTAEFCDTIQNLAFGLIKLGAVKKEEIGIISNPSPFWIMSDMAIVLSGCVTVPIFRRISPENLKFEIEDSRLNIIFIGDENEYDPVKLYGTGIKKIVTIGFKKEDPNSITFDELITLGRKFRNEQKDLNGYLPKPDENALFTIIYTSGSTGIPKGVMLTHKNMISQIKAAGQVYDINEKTDRALSSLPLSHIFERMVMYFYLSKGVPVYFVDDLNNIGNLIREVKPTIMTAVPRLLEKVYATMKNSIDEYKGLKKILLKNAFHRAETKDVNKKFYGPGDFLYRKLVYSQLQNALGGQFRYLISGAASLPYDVGRFFMNIGIPLYEGYGMTEASPVIACNSLHANKLGTVGRPYPSVTIKISGEGEVLAKGPNIMLGYFNNPEETGKCLDSDGFLHTGDLGNIDSEGYLKITGRKKELFKKSTGEYVPPIPIEQALSRLEIADSAVVIAENRKFVSCLIFPDFDKVEKMKQKNGFTGMSTTEFLDSDFIKKRTEDSIKEINRHLHHTEEVQKFTIIKTHISIETGELTPTLKIRRNVIEEKFKREIDAMYL